MATGGGTNRGDQHEGGPFEKPHWLSSSSSVPSMAGTHESGTGNCMSEPALIPIRSFEGLSLPSSASVGLEVMKDALSMVPRQNMANSFPIHRASTGQVISHAHPSSQRPIVAGGHLGMEEANTSTSHKPAFSRSLLDFLENGGDGGGGANDGNGRNRSRSGSPPLPYGVEKCFDLRTGRTFYKDHTTGTTSWEDPRVRNVPANNTDPWQGLWRVLSKAVPEARTGRAIPATVPAPVPAAEILSRSMSLSMPVPDSPGEITNNSIPPEEKLARWKRESEQEVQWQRQQQSGQSWARIAPTVNVENLDLELSLRLGSSDNAKDSSSVGLQQQHQSASMSSFSAGLHSPRDAPPRETMSKRIKLEPVEDPGQQSFPGLLNTHNMGPFPSNFTTRATEQQHPQQPPSSFPRAESPASRTKTFFSTPSTCNEAGIPAPARAAAAQGDSPRGPEGSRHFPASGKVDLEWFSRSLENAPFHPIKGNFANVPNFPYSKPDPMESRSVAEEPMPSSRDQAQVSCTLEKIQEALKRSQYPSNAVAVPIAATAVPPSPVSLMRNASTPHDFSSWAVTSFAHCVPSPSPAVAPAPALARIPVPVMACPAKSPALRRSLSPTTSDASSAASSKSSRHTSTSASVMSFQGEELDDPTAGGPHALSNADASPASFQVLRLLDAQAQGIAGDLKTAGCLKCRLFFLLPGDNPQCPKCGSSGSRLMEMTTPRKERAMA